MNWGKSIVLTFVLFASFIGTMVYLMSRQRVDLVRDDYYQNELAFQQQINRVSNAARLHQPFQMTYHEDRQQVTFVLPTSLRRGDITFYRPADRRADFHVPIPPEHPTRHVVPTAKLARGYWRVQFSWSDGQREYYAEEDLFL